MEKEAAVPIVSLFLFLALASLISFSSGTVVSRNALGFSVPQPTEDWWPTFHHDQTHAGYSTSTAPTTNQTLWTNSTESYALDSSPVVADGVVFEGSQNGVVYALNASTGSLVWSYATGGPVSSSASVVDGTVYAGSFDGNVYALDEATGSKLWNYTTGSVVYRSSPAIASGVVFVGSADKNIYALNASNGELIWNYTTGNHVYSSPAIAGGVVFVGSLDDSVYALNASTGAYIWSYATNGPVSSSPAVAGGVVFVGAQDNRVYALNATTGAVVWKYRTNGAVYYSSPAIAGGVVFVGSLDDSVYALNASTGAYIWSYATGYWITSSPAVAGGVVFVGSGDYSVYALNASTGAYVWSYKTNGAVYSSPAVVDGVVYVGSQDGNVYAFGEIQYFLALETNPQGVATLSGDGWYNAGAHASISAEDFASLNPGSSRYRFNGWATQDMSELADPSALSTSVLMDGSKTVKANFVLQYNVTFNESGIQTDFTGTAVTIDGTTYGADSFPLSFWWDNNSSHSFAHESPLVVEPTAKQYVWTGTSGLSALQNDTLDVTASGSITASYKTQYYLALPTDPWGITSPSGAGWWDYGTYAPISTAPYVNLVSGSSRYGFQAWQTRDMSELADPSSASTLVFMDESKTITADYTLQYRVFLAETGLGNSSGTVVSIDGENYDAQGLPAFFWWNNGSSHSFAYQSPLTAVTGRYLWNSSSGLSTLPSGNITVFGPGEVTGKYNLQYYVTVTSVHGTPTPSSWVDSNASFTASVPSPADIVPNEYQWVCTGYSVDGGTPVAGATYTFTNVTTSHTITFNWKEQFCVTFIQAGVGSDFLGTVVTVNGTGYGHSGYSVWSYPYDIYSFAYSSPLVVASNQKRYVWNYTNGLSNQQSGFITVSSYGTVTGNYKTQYNQSLLEVTTNSPVDILVTSPNGSRVGYNWTTQSIINEINGATYTGPETESQIITIPSPLPGAYTIDAYGTGAGSYTITIDSISENGSTITTLVLNGTTSSGQLHQNTVQLQEDGTITIPEFPSLITLPLLMMATLLIALAERKLKLQKPACKPQPR